jgi:replicative DNA helicase
MNKFTIEDFDNLLPMLKIRDNTQVHILRLLFSDKKFASEAKPLIYKRPVSIFGEKIFQKIIDEFYLIHDLNNKFPERAEFKAILEISDKFEKDVLHDMNVVINKTFLDNNPNDNNHPEKVKDNKDVMAKFFDAVDYLNAFLYTKEVVNKMCEGDIKHITDDYGKYFIPVRRTERNNTTLFSDVQSVFNDFSSALSNDGVITTGSTQLDKVLHGGFLKKRFYVLAGIPGAGKSLWLANFAMAGFNSGKKVLLVTLEIDKGTYLARLASHLLGHSVEKRLGYNEIESGESISPEVFKDIIDDMKERMNGKAGEIVVQEYGTNEISAKDIEAQVHEVKERYNIDIDIIIIDYMILLKSDSIATPLDNSSKYYKTVAEELRNLALRLNVPLVTAAQINREGMATEGGSKIHLSGKHVADSKGIIDTADFFAVITQTKSDKNNKILSLTISKNRNGKSDDTFEYKVCFSSFQVIDKTFTI